MKKQVRFSRGYSPQNNRYAFLHAAFGRLFFAQMGVCHPPLSGFCLPERGTTMRKVPLPDGAKLYLYTAALTALAAGEMSNAAHAVVEVANTLTVNVLTQ